ncbi:MAG TPA: endonuclease/exonuclease/phosphatase family protein [Sphingobacterium sp.]|nr:endonuclease/exonuclease/phosphatase family protein [Sphingobacterium sp.]
MTFKNWKNILAFILLMGLCQPILAQEKQTSLRVLTYNIRFGELASLQELGEYIKKLDPDIVALQEVDINTVRERASHQNNKNFIAELGYYTGMFSSFAKAIPYRGGWYGVGVLSKYPIMATHTYPLPYPEGSKEQRVLQIAKIEIEPSKEIIVANTHLDYPNSEVRQEQVKFINKKLQNVKEPKLFFGDFNAYPSSIEIKKGMGEWLDISGTDPTVPVKKPKNKIDYIFAYPKQKWEKKYSETLQGVDLSDHLPILVEVGLK